MRRALIDTNIYSLALRGDPEVVARLQQLDEIGFTVVSIGELMAGFRQGSKEARNRQELARFLDSPRVKVLAVDEETADFYAAMIVALKRVSTPIPTNDIWIAALAQRHGLPLYTSDAHFIAVPGLVLMP